MSDLFEIQPPQSAEAVTPGSGYHSPAPSLREAGTNYSEAHRLACEARYVASKQESWRKSYLAGVEVKRGKVAADELRKAVFEFLRVAK